ncbi:FliA/WhiG family RNA polymerase sigma factor [soil metagenome]
MKAKKLQANSTSDEALIARRRLAEEHLGLVHHVARQLYNGYRADADFDEMVSAGSIGLMNAIDSFDASFGVKFSTFAAPRIRGAIQDELRRMDHVSRSVRRKLRDISTAREELTRDLGRTPERKEIAAHLGITIETLWRWEVDTEVASQVSLSAPMGHDVHGRTVSALDSLVGDTEEVVEGALNMSQESALLREALLDLKQQERTVLSLYYFEELKLAEIAVILGLTESRVSQIRTKALSKLRAELSPLRMQVA